MLKLRASTVTARGVSPLFDTENAPLQFFPHSTMTGETVCAKTGNPKTKSPSVANTKVFFMGSILLGRNNRMRPKCRALGRCARKLRGLGTDRDGARVAGYR